MTNYVCFLVVSYLFLFVSLNELKAGDIPPPETIGACCLNSELGICEELSLEECVLSGDLGFGWSDEFPANLIHVYRILRGMKTAALNTPQQHVRILNVRKRFVK